MARSAFYWIRLLGAGITIDGLTGSDYQQPTLLQVIPALISERPCSDDKALLGWPLFHHKSYVPVLILEINRWEKRSGCAFVPIATIIISGAENKGRISS